MDQDQAFLSPSRRRAFRAQLNLGVASSAALAGRGQTRHETRDNVSFRPMPMLTLSDETVTTMNSNIPPIPPFPPQAGSISDYLDAAQPDTHSPFSNLPNPLQPPTLRPDTTNDLLFIPDFDNSSEDTSMGGFADVGEAVNRNESPVWSTLGLLGNHFSNVDRTTPHSERFARYYSSRARRPRRALIRQSQSSDDEYSTDDYGERRQFSRNNTPSEVPDDTVPSSSEIEQNRLL